MECSHPQIMESFKSTVLVDRMMSAEVVSEIACRMKCPPPLARNIAATRKELKNHRLFLGPRRAFTQDISPDEYLLLAEHDAVWQGSASPEYALWYLKLDQSKLKEYVTQKNGGR